MKEYAKNVMLIFGIIGIIIFSVWGFALSFQNPDMTDLRFFIEFPHVYIGGIVSAIITAIGRKL